MLVRKKATSREKAETAAGHVSLSANPDFVKLYE
jgi:hypothetical protein